MDGTIGEARRYAAEGAWSRARSAFAAATAADGGAEAYEGLADACRRLDDIDSAIEALEHAHRLHIEAGRLPDAATTAVRLAELVVDHRGEPAVVSGWLQRARDQLRDSPDHPTLVSITGLEAYLALAYDKDPVAAQRAVEAAMELAQRLGMTDVVTVARAQMGLVKVSQGELDEGMRLLDVATASAVAGDLSRNDELNTYCFLITACERVRDFDRVDQWSQRVLRLASESGSESFAAFARTQYANVLIWRGRWEEAETELTPLIGDTAGRPHSAAVGLVLMSSLRRRQGRLEEADELLARAEREPLRSVVRHLVLGARAALSLDAGHPQAAADLSERLLRAIAREDRIERVDALETVVRARALLGQPELAAIAAGELDEIAEAIPTGPIEGAALAARGIAAMAAGDLAAALDAVERAIVLFDTNGVRHDAVRTRLTLAELLIEVGRTGAALREAGEAQVMATDLGAAADVSAAERVLSTLRPDGPGGLTKREREVLALVANGLTNGQIADDLYLSVRTVERHTSNIYAKIGAFGRSARVVATAYARAHSIT